MRLGKDAAITSSESICFGLGYMAKARKDSYRVIELMVFDERCDEMGWDEDEMYSWMIKGGK